jgi:hypothetical protein
MNGSIVRKKKKENEVHLPTKPLTMIIKCSGNCPCSAASDFELQMSSPPLRLGSTSRYFNFSFCFTAGDQKHPTHLLLSIWACVVEPHSLSRVTVWCHWPRRGWPFEKPVDPVIDPAASINRVKRREGFSPEVSTKP